IAPPICQTELHEEFVLSSLSDDLVEMYKCFFVPLIGRETKRMITRPISKVGHRLHIVRSTFAKRPNSDNLDSSVRCLLHSFRHSFTVLVAIHYCDVRPHEAKRLSIDNKTSLARSNKLRTNSR